MTLKKHPVHVSAHAADFLFDRHGLVGPGGQGLLPPLPGENLPPESIGAVAILFTCCSSPGCCCSSSNRLRAVPCRLYGRGPFSA